MKKLLKLTIPDGVTFADLELQRGTFGRISYVSFSVLVIERVCAANGIDLETLLSDEDSVSGVIAAWYARHIELGGDHNPAADLIFETTTEDAA